MTRLFVESAQQYTSEIHGQKVLVNVREAYGFVSESIAYENVAMLPSENADGADPADFVFCWIGRVVEVFRIFTLRSDKVLRRRLHLQGMVRSQFVVRRSEFVQGSLLC